MTKGDSEVWETGGFEEGDFPSTVTVQRLPAWARSGDVIRIERRASNTRSYIRSLTQTEPRWRQYARRLRALLKPSEKGKK